MAAKPKTTIEEVGLGGSRLKKLTIRSFRCIGPSGVSIELDQIVVLVGANNVGKSTILKAYEYVMEHSNISKEDFPGGKFDTENPPEVELETWLGKETPGDEWIIRDDPSGSYIREKWTWGEDLKPSRKGYRQDTGWDERVPWGAPNVAKARRPKPHRVSAFASPQEQADQVAGLLLQWVKDHAKIEKFDDEGSDVSAFGKLKKLYSEAHSEVVQETSERLETAERAISKIVSKVFKGYEVKFESSPSDKSDKILDLLLSSPTLRMGPKDGFMANVQDQGSGAQRTLLWAALKLLAEQKPAKKVKSTAKKQETPDDEDTRPNVLLIDEPEICLHPSAVREACNTLYKLAEDSDDWQIMITTHSPVFIDLSRDHTTIVRVERTELGEVTGTTIFRPSEAKLTEDDRINLKLLNIWDPYVAEFFFGGRTVLVEGDTEYSAFKVIVADDPEKYRDLHVVRARGKAILVPLIKILNHFGKPFGVIHDADAPIIETKKGPRVNAMWTMNMRIKDAILDSPRISEIRHLASIKDFESALFGEEASSDKPFAAWKKISGSAELKETCSKVLDFLLGLEERPPEGFLVWNDEADLSSACAIQSAGAHPL